MPRILSIGDQRVSLDLARTLLGREGHDLIEATDALAGLHRAAEDAPDCIVLELDLAGFDGLELCRMLGRDATTCRIPVVVWGTLAARHAAPRAKRSGAFAYVDRTSAPGALMGSVRRALADARRRGDASSVPALAPLRAGAPRL